MHTSQNSSEFRFRAIKTYLNGERSIRAIAREFGIHSVTLWRWLKSYRELGEEHMVRKGDYRRPWNRPSKETEEKITFIKENNPSITVRDAQKLLGNNGISVSIKGIWSIWKRYGFVGFNKAKLSHNYREYINIPCETKEKVRNISVLLARGEIKESARIINQLPTCSVAGILEKIPDRMLNSKRKLEKISFYFGRISHASYRRKANKLRQILMKTGCHYSALRAGLEEAIALEWQGKPLEQLRLIKELKEMITVKRGHANFSIWFTLIISEGIAYARLLETKKAIASLKNCTRYRRTLTNASFLCDIAVLCSHLGYYREMSSILKKIQLEELSEERKAYVLLSICTTLVMRGDYATAQAILKLLPSAIEDESTKMLLLAWCYLCQGKIDLAKETANIAYKEAKSMGIMNYVNTTSLLLASAYSATRDKRRANILLSRYAELLRKKGMIKDAISRDIMIDQHPKTTKIEDDRTIKLALLVKRASLTKKETKYWQAYNFAFRYELMGIFHRLVLLMPESISALLDEGKPTGLPRSILRFPVFRKEIPVYSINFLGNLKIQKNQKYLKVHLSPKETAFIVYLASQKENHIPLRMLYKNFWPKTAHPSRNLAHLLVRIRRALKLPSHYLYIKEDSLCYDCYFATDYGEYQEHIAQAKALLRADEWGFAKREYLQALKLFRGEPFRKMYDDWSDDKRLEVLFGYETEILSFNKELIRRGREEEARKLLKKAEKVVPLERK